MDINPYLNPYIRYKMGDEKTVQPEGAAYDPAQPGALIADSAVVKKFKKLGCGGGGNGLYLISIRLPIISTLAMKA